MRRLVASFLALLVANPAFGQVCYTQSDIARVVPYGWRVEQSTTPPASDNLGSYKYYPLNATDTQTLDSAQSSSWSGGVVYHRIWVNRWSGGYPNTKPNNIVGPTITVNDGVHGSAPCFLAYSSPSFADAATESEVSYTIGRWTTHNNRNGWMDYPLNAGMSASNVYEYSAFASVAQSLCTNWDAAHGVYYVTDVVVEPSSKLSTLPLGMQGGVELDWETQSGEPTTETNAVIYEIGQNIHGKNANYKLKLYTNPLDGSSAPYNGITSANVDYILAHVDVFGILVWPANPAHKTVQQTLDDQMAMFTSPNTSKLNLIADMAMSLSDAQTLHTSITSQYSFGGIEFWYDGQSAGGVCSTGYNQTVAALLGIQ